MGEEKIKCVAMEEYTGSHEKHKADDACEHVAFR